VLITVAGDVDQVLLGKLEALGQDIDQLSGIATAPVLGGGHEVGRLQATDFLNANLSAPVNEAL